jgi:hypothetical protein
MNSFDSIKTVKLDSEDIARMKNKEIIVLGANTSQWAWVLLNTAIMTIGIALSGIILYIVSFGFGFTFLQDFSRLLVNMSMPSSIVFLILFLKIIKKIEYKNGNKSAFLILSKVSFFKAYFVEPKKNDTFEPIPVQDFTKIG